MSDASRGRVLVVDDDAMTLTLLGATLEDAGWEVPTRSRALGATSFGRRCPLAPPRGACARRSAISISTLTETPATLRAGRDRATIRLRVTDRPSKLDTVAGKPGVTPRRPRDEPTAEPSAQPEEDRLVGRVIDGRYEVVARIGEGGMGTVYRARHVELGNELAIKVLAAGAATHPDAVERFVREARVVARLAHDNVVAVSDFGELPDGSLYFVMELVEGDSLREVIRRQAPMPPAEVIAITRQIASGLGAAHEAGCVHRDVKPDNVLIGARGAEPRVKVVDFGVAKVEDDGRRLTRTGAVCGTPLYVSPEQVRGDAVDARTDIYSLGAVMYEMVTGRPPFERQTDVMQLLFKHLKVDPPLPSAHDLPHPIGRLEHVIVRALRKDPDQRFQSMAELIAALEDAGPAARPERRPRPPPRARPAPAAPAPRPRGPVAARGVAAAALLLVLGAGVVALALRGSADDGEAASASTSASGGGATPPAAGNESASPTSGRGAVSPASQLAVDARVLQLLSVPEGAEVHAGDTMIGNTPAFVRRPAEGETLTLIVRMPGHAERVVTLDDRSPIQTRITLVPVVAAEEPELPRERAHSRRGAPPSPPPTPAERGPSAPRMEPTRAAIDIPPEVMNPWADP